MIVTTVLAIIGLSGLADGFVEWRGFFEAGFMEHYRAVKGLLLSWLPFKVPLWLPDYIVIASVFFRHLRKRRWIKKVGLDHTMICIYWLRFFGQQVL